MFTQEAIGTKTDMHVWPCRRQVCVLTHRPRASRDITETEMTCMRAGHVLKSRQHMPGGLQ